MKPMIRSHQDEKLNGVVSELIDTLAETRAQIRVLEDLETETGNMLKAMGPGAWHSQINRCVVSVFKRHDIQIQDLIEHCGISKKIVKRFTKKIKVSKCTVSPLSSNVINLPVSA